MGIKNLSSRDANNLHFEFPDAYFKIGSVRMDESKVYFEVLGYADKTSRDHFAASSQSIPVNGNGRIYSKNYQVETVNLTIPAASEGETIDDVVKKALYVYIKTLSEWVSATDVI